VGREIGVRLRTASVRSGRNLILFGQACAALFCRQATALILAVRMLILNKNCAQLRVFFKTKLCKYAPSGRCKHGAACRFAHSPDEVHPGPPVSLREAGHELQVAASNGDWTDSPSEQSTREISSDQSTRAGTNASVPTPEGSGDSGQEESPAAGPAQMFRRMGMSDERGPRPERRADRQNARHCTTLMVTNVPNFLTQGALVSLLEDLTPFLRGAFDFFFCPWDPYEDCNLGYVIINFFSRATAVEFEQQWTNQHLLRGTQTKRLRILPAALQGRAANLRHFSGFSLAHHADPRFRPLVRPAPQSHLRPMALPQELAQTQRQGAEQGMQLQMSCAPLSHTRPENSKPSQNKLRTMLAEVVAQVAQNTQPMQGNWDINCIDGAELSLLMQPVQDVPWPQNNSTEGMSVPGVPMLANDQAMQQYWTMMLPQSMTATAPSSSQNHAGIAMLP